MDKTGQDSTAERKCPQCGATLPAGTPPELCPKCLLMAGIAPEAAGVPTVGASSSTGVPSRGMPQPGEQLGHYEIVRLMGEGGMGAVFEALDLESGRRVALKVLSHALDSPDARQRFFREGRLAASLNHPNSVYVFGTEEILGIPVIAMELVPGGTLHDRVRALGPMPASEAVDAVLQIIAGLEAAQRVGIMHRDIKPSNCFLAPGGTVKVGDFGLSISTSIRIEPALTATGAFLGTPAFCSPEQLRGDELTFRSDMYSVGATLFFLLTGRTPFEGKNVVQLLATVLEKKAPSPRRFRREIPRGLANVVLRCLEKEPGERFRSYRDLARALAPYGATAATPATLGLRFAAGVLDMFFLSCASSAIVVLLSVDVFAFLNKAALGNPYAMSLLALGAGASVLYYTVLEGIWGATLGKALFRLRVVGTGQAPPGLLRAALRAFFYVVLPALPFWVFYGTGLYVSWNVSFVIQQALAFSFYVVLALLFVTARRRNGYAAVHDLLTGSRVISQAALQSRPLLGAPESAPVSVSGSTVIGPYHVLENLGSAEDAVWLLGYDLRLLRKVWIRKVPDGTPPISASIRAFSRVGRLRWLAGRRAQNDNWDAFEALTGRPLLVLAAEPQPWSRVRFWLLDLASELRASLREDTAPAVLSPGRVWITEDGRAKLLDFSVPMGSESGPLPAGTSELASKESGCAPPLINTDATSRFLAEVSAVVLQGRAVAGPDIPRQIARPLPLHARSFLEGLPSLPDADAVVNALKPLLNRLPSISRLRRASVVAGCIALPLLAGLGSILGMSFMRQWNQSGIVELNVLLSVHRSVNSSMFRGKPHPSDEQFGIYIAGHYRNVITNDSLWNSPFTRSMIKEDFRRFAESSIARYSSPSAQQIADAEAALEPYLKNPIKLVDPRKNPWLPLIIMISTLAVYVGLPALAAALLFRGGLILRVAGIAFVRSNGVIASRLRVFWRTIIAWSPAVLAVPLAGALEPFLGMAGAVVAVGSLLVTVVLGSLCLPARGLPERLSGTWPVPR